MIRLLNNEALPVFSTNWLSTYIRSRYLAYGNNASFAPFFVDDNNNVLSVLNEHAVFYAENPNIEEWTCFLAMHPDICSVTASLEIAEEMAIVFQQPIQTKKVMQLQKPLPSPEIDITELSPREAYPLLSSVFGDTMPIFDDWYVDVSHRIRHDNCTIAGVQWDMQTVSTAMTVAQSEDAVVIGAVATAQTARKRGFAAQCIRYLADKNRDKTIMISPKNPYAEQLYTAMGFTVLDTVGQINIRKEAL